MSGPSGLQLTDTLEDAFKRADSLAEPNGRWYSGTMTRNKDQRRIVLLVHELRKHLGRDEASDSIAFLRGK